MFVICSWWNSIVQIDAKGSWGEVIDAPLDQDFPVFRSGAGFTCSGKVMGEWMDGWMAAGMD